MKIAFYTLLFIGLSIAALHAQPCKTFDCAMQQARTAFDKKDFRKAFNGFKAAKAFDPTKAAEADVWIDKVFTAIEKQKIEADENAKKARMASEQATAAKTKAENAEIETLKALSQAGVEKQIAEAEKRKATAVLDKIYFYDDKFGLAFNKSNYRYGFIDKELKIKIAFKYQEALPFDYTGFAKVKREGIYYLIDTLGREYKLATDINQLGSSITALDLRNKELSNIPPSVFAQKQLKVLLLSGNQIHILSDSIAELSALQSLYLMNNKITQIPESFSKLSALQSLDLSNNQITQIPESFSKLSALKRLHVNSNKLTNLPSTFCAFKDLKKDIFGGEGFDFSNNPLKEIPDCLKKMKKE